MSVQELIKKLQTLPADMEVFVDVSSDYEFDHALVHNAEVKNLDFREDPDGEVLSNDKVVVIELI